MDYDPSQISYGELLDVFWESHDPRRSSWSRQYMAAVFYHNAEQKRLAEETRDSIENRTGSKVNTQILPYTVFHIAEDYHQKHAIQRFPELLEEFRAIYPSADDFVSSTAVTRVNGYLGGYGQCDNIRAEVGGLGLSDSGRERLLGIACGGRTIMPCIALK